MAINKRGLLNLFLVILVLLLVGVVVYLVFFTRPESVSQTPPPTTEDNSESARHLVAFEQAINNSNFPEASKYFPEKVFLLLDATECCGEVTNAETINQLQQTKGMSFTFDRQDPAVNAYISKVAYEYPYRRIMRNTPEPVYFDEFVIGIESGEMKAVKKVLGYKLTNGKITDLFISWYEN